MAETAEQIRAQIAQLQAKLAKLESSDKGSPKEAMPNKEADALVKEIAGPDVDYYGSGSNMIDAVEAAINARQRKSEAMPNKEADALVKDIAGPDVDYYGSGDNIIDVVETAINAALAKDSRTKAEPKPESEPAGEAGELDYGRAKDPNIFGQNDSEPAAQDVEEEEEDDYDVEGAAIKLFKNTHGTSFNPNSSMDKQKLEVMKKLLMDEENRSLSPNQFALKLYRQS